MPSSKRDYKSLARSLINQRLTIDAYSLHLVHVIGIGAFGVIFLADEYDGCVNTSRQFAVKCLLHSQKPSSDKFIVREKTLHPRIRHPHVVNVHAVIEQMDLVYIVMDYYPEGDLFKAIVDRQEYVGQDDKVRDAFLQVATGLRACHAQGVFHRDIKPENILVRSGYPGSYPKLALADFGLSTNDEYSTEFGVGSSYYMSLECGGGVDRHGIRQTAYSSRNNDVWSLGVLLINFACGRNPWVRAHPTEDTFAAFTRDPNYLLSILPISSELNDLLKAIFDLDPFNRIGLDDVIDRVKRIDRFTLNWKELCHVSDTVRIAAGPLLKVRERQDKALRLVSPIFEHGDDTAASSVPDPSPTVGASASEEGNAAWQALIQDDDLNGLFDPNYSCPGSLEGYDESRYGEGDFARGVYSDDLEDGYVGGSELDEESDSFEFSEVGGYSDEGGDRTLVGGNPADLPHRALSDPGQPTTDPVFVSRLIERRSPSVGHADMPRFPQTPFTVLGLPYDFVPDPSASHWATTSTPAAIVTPAAAVGTVTPSPDLTDDCDCASLPSTPGAGPMTPGNYAFLRPPLLCSHNYTSSDTASHGRETNTARPVAVATDKRLHYPTQPQSHLYPPHHHHSQYFSLNHDLHLLGLYQAYDNPFQHPHAAPPAHPVHSYATNTKFAPIANGMSTRDCYGDNLGPATMGVRGVAYHSQEYSRRPAAGAPHTNSPENRLLPGF